MWLSYHLPLTDLRALTVTPVDRLEPPRWPQPDAGRGFTRGFGAVEARPYGHAGWMGDPLVCDASHALRLDPAWKLPVGEKPQAPEVLYRQVACDGGAVARIDFGVWIDLPTQGLEPAGVSAVLDAFLEMPVTVRVPAPGTPSVRTSLIRSGHLLAEAWQWATTATRHVPPGQGWVIPGIPLLFVTLEPGERLELPAHARNIPVAPSDRFVLEHLLLFHRSQPVRLYAVHLTDDTDTAREETIEITLKRLHVDASCVQAVLSRLEAGVATPTGALLAAEGPPLVAPPPRTPESDRFQRNLQKIVRRLNRLDRRARELSNDGAPIHADLTCSSTGGQRIEAAVTRLGDVLRQQDVRPNVALNVQAVLRRMPGVLGLDRIDVPPPGEDSTLWRRSFDVTTGDIPDTAPGDEEDSTARAAEPVLHWNTGFPKDAAAERQRVLFTGVPYLLTTAIQVGANTIGDLTAGATVEQPSDEHLQTTPEGRKFFTVRFGVKAAGAVLTPAGSDRPPAPDVMSEPLKCWIDQGTAPFDLQLQAVSAGPVHLELTLFVNGGATLRRTVDLQAIQLGGALPANPPAAPPVPGPALPVSSLLDFPSTAVHLRVEFKEQRYWLEILMNSVRFAGEIPVASPAETLETTAITLRQKLIELSTAYEAETSPADPMSGLRLVKPPEAMLNVAKIGSQLYRTLFGRRGDLSVPEALHIVAEVIAGLGQDSVEPPRMQIDAEHLPFPWAIMYDGPEPETAADVRVKSFWGARFNINRVASVTLARVAPGSAVSPLQVIACLNPNLDRDQNVAVLENQRKFLAGEPVKASLIESGAALKDFLNNAAPCSFLYFFCHATAAQTLDRNLFRESTCPRAAATIELDKPPLSIEDLCDIRLSPLPARPLVFMNACSSAQGDGVFQSMFLTHFYGTWRTSGFIGTDWMVHTVFADGFARLFLQGFLVEHRPIADAFHAATMRVLELNNPFPLIYALYVRPDYRL